jgi:hypothetical protein
LRPAVADGLPLTGSSEALDCSLRAVGHLPGFQSPTGSARGQGPPVTPPNGCVRVYTMAPEGKGKIYADLDGARLLHNVKDLAQRQPAGGSGDRSFFDLFRGGRGTGTIHRREHAHKSKLGKLLHFFHRAETSVHLPEVGGRSILPAFRALTLCPACTSHG